jgi:hypothetical protein
MLHSLYLLVLAVLLLLVSTVTQAHHLLYSGTRLRKDLCLSKSWNTHIFAISNTRRSYDGMAVMFFDQVNERFRIDSELLDPIQKSVQMFYIGKNNRFYVYCKKSKRCRSFPVPKRYKMKQPCLPHDQTRKRPQSLRLGKSLKTTQFVVHRKGGKYEEEEGLLRGTCHHRAEYIEVTVEPTSDNEVSNIGIPIGMRQWGGRLGKGNHLSEFSNFNDHGDKGLDDKDFDLPDACKKKSKRLLMESSTASLDVDAEVGDVLGPFLMDSLFENL